MKAIAIQRYTKDHSKHFLVLGLALLWLLTSILHFFTSGIFGAGNTAFAGTASGSLLSQNSLLNIGPGTEALMNDLKNKNLDPEIVANNTRAFFSVEGKMITLASGNIKVYEYTDNNILLNEVEAFKENSKTPYGSWKKDVHLYNNAKVIVFYMGEDKEIKDTLNTIFGSEVKK
ncbi:MAG: hypothetical protein JWP09_122 [Candidatus Taylorbacteria bacterium]|nr:hypothetical protein [Candidatus Taylorbacteria bacterium]